MKIDVGIRCKIFPRILELFSLFSAVLAENKNSGKRKKNSAKDFNWIFNIKSLESFHLGWIKSMMNEIRMVLYLEIIIGTILQFRRIIRSSFNCDGLLVWFLLYDKSIVHEAKLYERPLTLLSGLIGNWELWHPFILRCNAQNAFHLEANLNISVSCS